LCTLDLISVKIEVNGIQRGIIGNCIELPLSEKAQAEFRLFSKAQIVPLTQLYGGKLGAALDRQHPRDLFDVRHMDISNYETIREGLIYNFLSSPKPIIESLAPNPINQMEALENQFSGMTDLPFSYEDYEQTRQQLGVFVNSNLTKSDREFLISFEKGSPAWQNSEYEKLKDFPSVQWKQLNINKLKEINFEKYQANVDKLTNWLDRTQGKTIPKKINPS